MQPEMEQKKKSLKQRLVLKNTLAKETLSEFLGTFIMIVLGCGSVAQAVLSRGHFGGIITINTGFSMAVAMAIYVSAGVSGLLLGFSSTHPGLYVNNLIITATSTGPRYERGPLQL